MLLKEAYILAIRTLDKYGLLEKGWILRITRSKTRAGDCNSALKTIRLSRYFIEKNDKAVVQQVITHETAHALVGSWNGHNQIWADKCVELGIEPEIYCKRSYMPKGKWTAKCTICNTSYNYHNKPKGERYCRYDDNQLIWNKRIKSV